MINWLTELCGGAFMPHGQCYLWQPGLIWLHAISDTLIALAYYSIPLTILHFVRKRADVPFRGVFVMFGVFIVACGTTHLIEVWTIWEPHYWLSGSVKAFTAIVSLATAGALVRIVPAALNLPSPNTLRALNTDLEQRVQARTADLTAINTRLHDEIHQRQQAETEIRRLNDSLQQRVAELQTLFDLLPVGVGIASDPACRVIRTNPALARMLDAPRNANVSKTAPSAAPVNFDVFQGARLLKPDELPMQRCAATNTPVVNFEETVVHADGRRIELLVNVVPLRDEEGRSRGCIATLQDITAQRKAEQERIAFERRLQDTQKLESLGILAGGIAHDFNNLLTGILGNASIARMDLSPSQVNVLTALSHVERASLRASELCKQLLAYAGKGRFVIQPLDLTQIIEETTHLLEVSVSKKISLQLVLAPHLPAFLGDATQIRQVVMNLVINASEAIGENRGVVTVQTKVVHLTADDLSQLAFVDPIADGTYVSLEVSDTGVGMKPDVLERIFDPFFTTKFTGRGLGLAAVIGIVRGHKGAIKVYSEPDRGSTFRLLFPAVADAAAPGGVNPLADDVNWRGEGDVLVIDDEDDVRDVSRRMLLRAGFQVTLAHDGIEGIEILRKDPLRFRLVLLDLTMPRMDGEETLREIRGIQPHIPVILTSGFNEQATVNRFVGRGLAGFIAKPFTFRMLIQKIRETLERPAPPHPIN